MKLTIEINGNNSAFEDNPNEFNRIISEQFWLLTDSVMNSEEIEQPLHDSNGNKVGYIKLEDK